MASLAQMVANAFGMSDEIWTRHANPWSVYTRIATVPFIILTLWSRAWIGAWSFVPVALLVVWLWYNPRAFPPPQSTDNWASKAVLGERVWLNRHSVPIPAHHLRAVQLLGMFATIGIPVFVYGIVMLELWPTLLGMAITMLGKLWFIDRMVWLYEDMKDATPQYRSWLH